MEIFNSLLSHEQPIERNHKIFEITEDYKVKDGTETTFCIAHQLYLS